MSLTLYSTQSLNSKKSPTFPAHLFFQKLFGFVFVPSVYSPHVGGLCCQCSPRRLAGPLGWRSLGSLGGLGGQGGLRCPCCFCLGCLGPVGYAWGTTHHFNPKLSLYVFCFVGIDHLFDLLECFGFCQVQQASSTLDPFVTFIKTIRMQLVVGTCQLRPPKKKFLYRQENSSLILF